jgi:glucan phosphorylase
MVDFNVKKPVCYFCAEFGLEANLPLYAGGLGVLAGDTIKEAADQNIPLVAVGLLYRGGNAIQVIDESGWQSEKDLDIDPVKSGFEHVYTVDDPDQPLFIRVHLTRQDVWARVWRRTVNQMTVYLLDTDTDQNEPEDRGINHALYYGSEEVLVKQQMLLGIGGVKLIHALGIDPCLFHINEGRPSFLYWQLIRHYMDKEGMNYQDAGTKAKSKIVYTNHTLVRAGNQSYDTNLLRNYAMYYAQKMQVTIDELLAPGMDSTTNKFNMTQFALNTSVKASAVSQSHFELSKNIWPEFEWVGITNGVHMPTWQDKEIRECDKSGDELWKVHNKKKAELVEFIQNRTGFGYDPNRLVLGWARRIAGYKRPQALFEDIDRMVRICKDSQRPVQFLMAGKAHAKDTTAKSQLQQIIQYMQNQLNGYALFIPNYDLDVARMMVKGVDVWVNSPIPGQEASGTSGMKAVSNGVLQLTVEDGWTAEVNWHGMGWTLDGNHLSQTFYFRMEQDVVPTFYERNANGVPERWLERMKKSIELSNQFSTTRMLHEYREKLYYFCDW